MRPAGLLVAPPLVAPPLVALLAVATACDGRSYGAFSDACTGIRAAAIDHAVAPPANVSLLVRVTDCDLRPLGRRLDPSSFAIQEDKTELSSVEAAREVLPAKRQTSERILFALDISASITRTGLRDSMIDAARDLADHLANGRSIGVFVFDGRPDLVPLTYFSTDQRAVDDAFDHARSEPLVDDSTNLNGAAAAGLAVLDRAIEADQRDIYTVAHGTLVLFTDGHDLAHRVADDTLAAALDKTPHATYAIGVSPGADPRALARVGRTGSFASITDPSIPDAFDRDQRALEARAEANYVVSYCSPSRAGMRTLTVLVHDGASTAGVDYTFDADGFGAGCSPAGSTLR